MMKIFRRITACLLSFFPLFFSPVLHAEALRYFGQTESGYQSHIPYGNNPAAGHYAQSGDARIYYEVYGQGEPLVVLHGGLVGSIAEMGEFIDKLSPHYQVIAVSTRGHGKSEAGKRAPTYAQKAQDLRAVLQQLTDKPVTLIGFSDGAYTAYQFAAAYPAQTGKLVAIGAGEWKKGFVQGTRTADAKFSDLEKLDPSYWRQQMDIRPEPQKTAAWFEAACTVYNETEVSAAVLRNVKAPVLLLAGEKDANAPLDTVIAAYRMMPNARLAIVADAPHPVFLVNFPAVWANIEPFLKQPPPSGGIPN